MFHHSRLIFVSFLLLLALIVPTNPVQAQTTSQAPIDKNVVPDANLAVPDEITQVVKLRESLTAEQIAKIHAILDSHKAELQQVSDSLASLETIPNARDKKLFLPLISVSGDTQNQEKAAEFAVTPEKAMQLSEIALNMVNLQAQIDGQVAEVLTPMQREVHVKHTAKLQKTAQAAVKLQVFATNLQSPDEVELLGDCWYGGAYSALANINAWNQYYYAYYDYLYFGNGYAYNSYVFSWNAYANTSAGLPLAGAAYFNVGWGFGNDNYGSASSARSYMSTAANWAYLGYNSAWSSWQVFGSNYWGYWSYYFGYDASAYAYSAAVYLASCN